MLSDPTLIDVLNAYTVPVNVDKNAERLHTAEERALCPAIASVGTRLVTPTGQLIELPGEICGRPLATARFIEDVARRSGVQRGPTRGYSVQPPPHDSDDLVLMQTSRFLETLADGKLQLPRDPEFHVPMSWDTMLHADKAWELHLHCPTREWTVLAPSLWRRLIPDGDRVGLRWDIDPALALELLYRFRPPTHYSHLDRGEVESCALEAEIVGADAGHLDIRLGGRVKIWHRWFPTAGEGVYLGEVERNGHWAESDVAGHAVYDRATGRFTRLSLVTDEGRYRGLDGTLLPYATVAAEWKP